MRARNLSALVLTLLSACSSGADGTGLGSTAQAVTTATGVASGDAATADAATTAPELVFDGAWGYHGVNARTPGSLGYIVYDTSRLPSCRATTDGVQAWAISAFVSVDGGAAISYPFPTGAEGPAVQVPIEIPYGSSMALWFEATDDSGCEQWDSSYGQNYVFSIDNPTRGVVHFAAGWTTSLEPAPGEEDALVDGATVDIDYDFRRLPQCRSSSGANPAWAITMFVQIDGGPVSSTELALTIDGSEIQQPGHVTLPTGAKTIALWFENDDVYGCNQWDSSYGANYNFAVH
jgi:hypothetical protein